MTVHRINRQCGACQLCCRLMPTAEIDKPANERCPHQRAGKGCAIHATKPMSCSLWNCRWLVDDDTGDQPRPDRSGIVLDLIPDVLHITNEETGERKAVPCIVAWIDPARPDAWRSPIFARYVARQTVPVLLRTSSSTSPGVLFPPAVTGLEHIAHKGSSVDADGPPTTLEEKAKVLGAELVLPPDDGTTGKATLRLPDGKVIEVGSNYL